MLVERQSMLLDLGNSLETKVFTSIDIVALVAPCSFSANRLLCAELNRC